MNPDATTARYLGALLERATGQRIQPGRGWLADASLAPLMRQRGYETLDALVAALAEGRDPDLAPAVVDALVNNETSFFRDGPTFLQIERELLPALAAARAGIRRLRIWCAGCSTGQETYSLGMIFAGADAMWRDWSIEIVASDVSASAIRRAEAGLYSSFEIQRGLPVTRMVRWFQPDGEDWRADRAIRRGVRFVVHNLLDPAPPAPGPFDLVLCRNLLLYLSDDRRRLAFQRLAATIAGDGYLVLGAGETVSGRTADFVADDAVRGLFRPAPVRRGRRAA